MRTIVAASIGPLALSALLLVAPAAMAQYGASTYSYGTYNPVQAAINRNSMNAAIIRQATGKKTPATKKRPRPKAGTRR